MNFCERKSCAWIFATVLTILIVAFSLAFSGCVHAGSEDSVSAVRPISNDALANHIESLSNADSTHYAVFVAYPMENRSEYIYQSSPMRSASMIKVFLLGTAMERVAQGTLSLDQTLTLRGEDKVGGAGVLAGYASGSELTLDTVLRFMITESDNTATNMVIDLLGMDAINDYIQRNGYHDTILRRKMMDYDAIAAGRENYTSVTDLGHFFVRLYDRSCVTPELDDVMLSYLAAQTDTECFPTALPGVMIAHKTGELDGLYDDGGIIYQVGKPFVMVCMTEAYSNRSRAIGTMQQMLLSAANDAGAPASSAQDTGVSEPTDDLENIVIDQSVTWTDEREELTRAYAMQHYGKDITTITPQAVVLHWTAGPTWESAWYQFDPVTRGDDTVNVSSQFLVDRDGTIYRLMPENKMARHTIGYNWCSIGIENVGGEGGEENLTDAQVAANARLIRALRAKYPTIQYIFGHYQQVEARESGLYLENVDGYYSVKSDPGPAFMQKVKEQLAGEELKFFSVR